MFDREPTDAEVLDYYATLSLAELRRHQDLTFQQQRMAFEQRNDRAMETLDRQDRLLARAIYRMAFGRDVE